MDKTMLRHQALNVATMRAKEGADIDSILSDAEKVFAWLTEGAVPDTTNQPSTTHESQAAVEGQEPKGE